MKEIKIQVFDLDRRLEAAKKYGIAPLLISPSPSYAELTEYLRHKIAPTIVRFLAFQTIIDRILEYPVFSVHGDLGTPMVHRLNEVLGYLEGHEERFEKEQAFEIHEEYILKIIREISSSDLIQRAEVCGSFMLEKGYLDMYYVVPVKSETVLKSEASRDLIAAIFQTLFDQGLFRSDLNRNDLAMYLSQMTGYSYSQFLKIIRVSGFAAKSEYSHSQLAAALEVLKESKSQIDAQLKKLNP